MKSRPLSHNETISTIMVINICIIVVVCAAADFSTHALFPRNKRSERFESESEAINTLYYNWKQAF